MLIGASFKTYLSHARTCAWLQAVAGTARTHPAVTSGAAKLFAMPQFPSIPAAVAIATPAGIAIGAQDVSAHDSGPWTGEVAGEVLAELGATMAVVGHAERRAHFGETDDVVGAKTLAALRAGLVPVICVGEDSPTGPRGAADAVRHQVDRAIAPAVGADRVGPVVVAYEPVWAIGAAEPAGAEHIRTVGAALRAHVAGLPGAQVVYGGSAGPGLLPQIADGVDGLFLGRFAHDPAAITTILDEVVALDAAAGAPA